MLSDEITVWGYIKVPYPCLDEFLLKTQNLKGKHEYKDFPDFILAPIISIGNALLMYGFTFRYEEGFENLLIDRFDCFLAEIKFLIATLQIDIDNKKYYYFEYFSDGESNYKKINSVISG